VTAAARIYLKGSIGARTVFRIPRDLVKVALTLDDVLAGAPPLLGGLPAAADGYLVTSLPEHFLGLLPDQGLRRIERQRYTRRYANLSGGYPAYLDGFSSKTRSTLLRKQRRFADGVPDVRMYRTVAEIEEFDRLARPLSRRTYQERLLAAGLSDNLERMRALAVKDALRAFILFREGAPAAYLYMPAHGTTLIYAYLGYDPDLASLSPGNVLQLGALEMLMEEGRFDRLDFTEGDGQHKAMFATDGVPCVDLLLLRPGLGNLLAASSVTLFDAAVARLRGVRDWPIIGPMVSAIRR
jgi:CelD/BcsL family acetyltransferase involved in cellulose biosynthesis